MKRFVYFFIIFLVCINYCYAREGIALSPACQVPDDNGKCYYDLISTEKTYYFSIYNYDNISREFNINIAPEFEDIIEIEPSTFIISRHNSLECERSPGCQKLNVSIDPKGLGPGRYSIGFDAETSDSASGALNLKLRLQSKILIEVPTPDLFEVYDISIEQKNQPRFGWIHIFWIFLILLELSYLSLIIYYRKRKTEFCIKSKNKRIKSAVYILSFVILIFSTSVIANTISQVGVIECFNNYDCIDSFCYNQKCIRTNISTNSPIYSSNVNQIITGSGFGENSVVNISIVNSTGYEIAQFITTSNQNGSFTYTWNVGQNNSDNYTLFGVDFLTSANTTFSILPPYNIYGIVFNSSAVERPANVYRIYDGIVVEIDDENYSITLDYGKYYDLLVVPLNQEEVLNITVKNIFNQGDLANVVGYDDLPEAGTSFDQVFAFIINITAYEKTIINFRNIGNAGIYKCTDWIFFTRTCLTSYSKIGSSSDSVISLDFYIGDPAIGLKSESISGLPYGGSEEELVVIHPGRSSYVSCGDKTCTGDESCENCPDDCGECFIDETLKDESEIIQPEKEFFLMKIFTGAYQRPSYIRYAKPDYFLFVVQMIFFILLILLILLFCEHRYIKLIKKIDPEGNIACIIKNRSLFHRNATNLILLDKMPASVNEFTLFVGDKESKIQEKTDLLKKKPILDILVNEIDSFFIRFDEFVMFVLKQKTQMMIIHPRERIAIQYNSQIDSEIHEAILKYIPGVSSRELIKKESNLLNEIIKKEVHKLKEHTSFKHDDTVATLEAINIKETKQGKKHTIKKKKSEKQNKKRNLGSIKTQKSVNKNTKSVKKAKKTVKKSKKHKK